MNQTMDSITRLIVEEAKKEVKLLSGFARLDEEREGFDHEIVKSSAGLDYAVSLAFPLSLGVLRTITDRPTTIYKHHYQQANYLLDRATLRISRMLEEEGFRALPVPASVYTSRSELKAHLCHRTIAQRAGLGWWGKNNLIVHPRFGAGIRLATVLTDAPLAPPGEPVSASFPDKAGTCGDCRACIDVCPVGAIGGSISDFDRNACFSKVREFERKVIGVGICGICVRACREARGNSQK